MKPQDFDPIFEAMLRQALRDNIYEEAESVPHDDVLKTMFTISKRHESRMRRLCEREDRREQLRGIMRPVRRVAVFAMVLITVLFSALMLNTTVRAAVREVIIEWYEQFTQFIGIQDNDPDESFDWSPEYLPEGYNEVSVIEGVPTIKEYEDENATLLLLRFSPESNDLRVDNEESEYSTEEIGNIIYYIFDAEPERKPKTIIWFREGYRFNLSGFIEVDELLNIAKSVKK